MSNKNRGPYLPNLEPIVAAGIDPKTGLPIKMGGTPITLLNDLLKIFRVIDEQDAVNRYKWYNLPDGLTSQLLERILYYKGQVCFFYNDIDDRFYALPYALKAPTNGTGIDFYGRYTGVQPIPWLGADSGDATTKANYARQLTYLNSLELKPLYEVLLPEEVIELGEEGLKKCCVLLNDYTPQFSQTIISRQTLNDPLLKVEAECIPFLRTALISGSGVRGMRVEGESEQANVWAANDAMYNAAVTGNINVPILGMTEFQDLNPGTLSKGEEYMQALQGLDNFRLSTYGLTNGGLWQKNAHMLESEQATNAAGGSGTNFVYNDGLAIRQTFCNIVNSAFDLGIWCEPSETATGFDQNMDGNGMDEQDQQGIANNVPAQGGGVENEY